MLRIPAKLMYDPAASTTWVREVAIAASAALPPCLSDLESRGDGALAREPDDHALSPLGQKGVRLPRSSRRIIGKAGNGQRQEYQSGRHDDSSSV